MPLIEQEGAAAHQDTQDEHEQGKDLSAGSKGYEDLRQTLSALTKVMNELQPILNQLKHQPNGLIFESGKPDTIEPKKHNPNNKVGNN